MPQRSEHHPPDHYEILGIPRTATGTEIKSAFRKRSMKAHPDRGGSNEEQTRLNRAFEVLRDPDRRRRYDRMLDARPKPAPVQSRYRSRCAGEWDAGLPVRGSSENFGARVRAAFGTRANEIRAGREVAARAAYGEHVQAFRKVRRQFAFSAAAAAVCGAAGFAFPPLWAGVVAGGYAMHRRMSYRSGADFVPVLDPDWRRVLRRWAAGKARREADERLARLDGLDAFASLIMAVAKKRSTAADTEEALFALMLIHFFMLGYVPDSGDAKGRIHTLRGADGSIAIACRVRAGGAVNAAFVKKLYGYMQANGLSKGFIPAPKGISKSAAGFADAQGIAYYSAGELNAWLGRMTRRRYPGPRGNIITHLESFMRFMENFGQGHIPPREPGA